MRKVVELWESAPGLRELIRTAGTSPSRRSMLEFLVERGHELSDIEELVLSDLAHLFEQAVDASVSAFEDGVEAAIAYSELLEPERFNRLSSVEIEKELRRLMYLVVSLARTAGTDVGCSGERTSDG